MRYHGAGPEACRGSFGGPQIGVVLESGAGTVDFGCATGTIDEPIFPGKDGLFSVKGTYRTGQSGPIKVGQIFKSQEAVYSGTIVKDAMTLSVKLEDETELGPFTLTLGAPAQVVRCR
ncbi:hypothetical protein H9L15_04850 [Sphingomonas daechungensis]|uniref:Uncharacterized protein n=1 Tax=Sphingomonas daechungensis TaxID=1176646 RepID=A0ABX6T5E8_9SPHN|nr:hypothetical protein [Sphingomonas daechungensis]QNP43943.1 hypothetical protein H9L15_04850 [Sphingomonas daechungensis]